MTRTLSPERAVACKRRLASGTELGANFLGLLSSHDPLAHAAIDLYVNRTLHELGGLDALVFTAGIGEHSAAIRSRVCRDAAWLGVAIDCTANEAHALCISDASSRVSVWTIPTNEELMLAQHALTLVHAGALS